ncbi:MAG TPA: hypothetical protein VK786_06205, partial [bacterium]|nr:hypothetical protein [bacterium]
MANRRVVIVTAIVLVAAAMGIQASEHFGGGGGGGGGMRSSGGGAFHTAPNQAARQPMIINMGRPSSGYNHNFPSQRNSLSTSTITPKAQPSFWARPSWGHVDWSSGAGFGQSGSAARPDQSRPAGPSTWSSRAPYGTFHPAAGVRMASVQHHHPYALGYVRHKLRKLGVSSEPSLITDRSEIIHTDGAHSRITYPTQGPQGAALSGHEFDPRGAADEGRMRTQMALVEDPGWRANVESYNGFENRAGQYYWHRDHGFNYCHYLDASGYHWYGWYMDDGFFWTRDFDGRWWWYDQAESRWDFYNDNYWWWQDPNHVGDLYCYNDGDYIPVNSAEDQIVVSQPDTSDYQVFTSPDGSRTVKLVAGGADAFLYDNSSQPAFDPVYLASGVQSVEFSDTSNGRPLEIVLKLDDGS